MPRCTYVNGRYLPHAKAMVHVEDRGYQFADAVYDVVVVLNGRLVDEDGHLDRLERSLREIHIPMPLSRRALQMVMREVIRRNALDGGLVYLQVSRGVAPREHAPPPDPLRPVLVVTTKHLDFAGMTKFSEGVSVITVPDQRWERRDIKTVNLLPNCLAKEQADRAGCYEAWQVDEEGFVTEGTASNAWIITDDGRIRTRPLSHAILRGVTRMTLLRLAAEEGLTVEERPFTVAEAHAAREAFATSASCFVTPVVKIDDAVLGDGTPGPFSRKLLAAYQAFARGG